MGDDIFQAHLVDGLDEAAAPEDRVVDDDLVLQRYNSQLPPSYRTNLDTERKLLIRALRVLVHSVLSDNYATDPESSTIASSEVLTSEGYQHDVEKDLGALEKGISRYVDLKHALDLSDYPLFINTVLRGSLTPTVDMGLRSKLARCASRLMSKRQCVLPEGIAWRPIIAQILRVHVHCLDGGPFIGKEVREAHCRNFVSVLSKCRNFLPPADSAEKIWAHFSPSMHDPDPDVQYEHLLFLSYLLPTRGASWSDWVPEGMQLWQCFDSSVDWDSIWMGLIGRLSRHQPCKVDWTPYLPWIYTRITDAFHLPLGTMAAHGSIDRRCPYQLHFLMEGKMIPMAAIFAVYSLSPRRPEAFEFLERLFALIANYFHPSNNGRWSSAIGSFLAQVSGTLASRVIDERLATKAGVTGRVIGDNTQKGVAPTEDRLTEECIEKLANILTPLVELGLHAKVTSLSVQAATASRDLSLILPDKVVSFIANAAEGLESISSPHRTTAALRVLAGLTPIFLDPDIFPNGSEYLPQALELTLPGIDPNDPNKTESTLRFIAGAAARIQGSVGSDQMPISVDFLEDYVRQLLDRIFIFLDSLEAPPKKTASGYTSIQSLSYFIFSVTIENVFAALPVPVVLSAARMVARQLTSTTCTNAMKYYGALVRTAAATAAAASDGSSVDLFIPPLLNQTLEESDEATDGLNYALVSVGEDEIVWRIRLLAQACRSCGTGLEPYLEKISHVIRLAFDKSPRPIYKAGGRLLRGVLEGLTSIQMEFDAGKSERDHAPDAEIYKFDWKVPTANDWNNAEGLIKTFISRAESICMKDDELSSDREVLFRTLRMLHALQRGGRWLLAGAQPKHFLALDKYVDEKIHLSKTDAKLILKRPIAAGLGGEENAGYGRERATELWDRIYSLILKIMKMILKGRPDDAAVLYRCLEPIELANEPFRSGTQSRPTMQASRSYKAAYKPVIASKRPFGSEGGVGRAMPRFIVKLRIEAHHQMRLSIAARPGMNSNDLCEEMFKCLTDLSLNDFPRVRSEARGVLTRTMRVMKPDVRKTEISRIIDTLRMSTSRESKEHVVMEDADSNAMDVSDSHSLSTPSSKKSKDDVVYEKMIGASAVLRSSAAAPLIMRDLGLFRQVIHALLEAIPKAERPDAAGAVGALFGKLSSLVRPLSLDGIHLIQEDMTTAAVIPRDEPSNAERREAYVDLYDSLLALLEHPMQPSETPDSPSKTAKKTEAHWRVQSLVATVLYIMVREDEAPPPAVAEFFARGMVSDVVALRSICVKGIMLILAMHGRKAGVGHPDGDTFDDSPSSWAGAGSPAIAKIGEVVCSNSFTRDLVHTLALDHEDETGDGGHRGTSVSSFAVMNAGRIADGDSLWMFSGGRPWPTSWTPRSRDHLNIMRMRVYESLVRVYGTSVYSSLVNNLRELIEKLERKEEKIISGVKDEDVRVLAGEVLAGICRGLDVVHCQDEVVERTIEELTWRLLSDLTGSMGNVNGATVIRLVATSDPFTVGPRIMKGVVVRLVESKPLIVAMGNGPHAHLQARRLRYLHSCIADLDDSEHPRMREIFDVAIRPLSSDVAFNHEMKTVREEVARFLSLLSVNVSKDGTVSFKEAMDGLVGEMTTSEEKMMKAEAEAPARDGDMNGDVKENEERKNRSRQGETLSRFISIVYWNGRARGFERCIAHIIPLLFKSFDESDPERISHARMALSFIAQGTFTQQTIADMVSAVEEISKDKRWKVRASVLSFLQVFSFTSLFHAKPSDVHRVRKVVLHLMSDTQLEVRQASAAAFVPMIRDASMEAVDDVRKSCTKVLKETEPKRRGGKRMAMDTETILKRHGAVLGLSSMVTSSPYSIPTWMPSVLVGLSGCVNDPPPISTGVRELFGDFMRTHRDEWQTHKKAFTPDELDIVLELLVSPSHYA